LISHNYTQVGPEYNLVAAANCRCIREFDDALTKVSFGWRSVDDYYAGGARCEHLGVHACPAPARMPA
jgi:predicted alpha/beta-fold hydrolase